MCFTGKCPNEDGMGECSGGDMSSCFKHEINEAPVYTKENIFCKANTTSSLTINNGSQNFIKFCANGDIYVKDRLIENDKELVEALREFLGLNKRK